MNLLVTGASGLIGMEIVRQARGEGWSVYGCGRTRPAGNPADRWREYDLRWNDIPPALLDGIDVVVHGALARNASPLDAGVNHAAARRLLDACGRHGARFAFLSSLAAHEGAKSDYGKHKYATERMVVERGALAIRPGLVLGAGGVFGEMCRYLRSHRLLPLFGGGRQPLQTIYVGDLARGVVEALASRLSGAFTAAENEPVDYRVFYAELCRQLEIRPRFVPLPFWAAEAATEMARRLGLRLPIDRDNLLGLQAMRADRGPRLPCLQARAYAANLALALADVERLAREAGGDAMSVRHQR